MTIPIHRVNDAHAKDAYAAYVGLRHLQTLRPDLARNEYFQALVDTAFARFHSAFEAL